MTTQPSFYAVPTPKPLPYHVTILYVVGDKLYLVVAYLRGLEWRYSDWQVRPKSDLPEVIRQAQLEGATIEDQRTEAAPDKPILLSYRIPLWHAQAAVTRLNRAIFAVPQRGEGLRRVRR